MDLIADTSLVIAMEREEHRDEWDRRTASSRRTRPTDFS